MTLALLFLFVLPAGRAQPATCSTLRLFALPESKSELNHQAGPRR